MFQWISRLVLFIVIFLFTFTAYAVSGINLPYGVTPTSREIYDLHMACFYICCVIGTLVFSILIYSLIKHRKSKGATAVHFHEHLGLEIVWTVIPFLILIGLAIPATIVLKHIHNTDRSALTIKVTGYQWKWKYEYLDQGISFFSNLSTPQDQILNNAPKGKWFLLEVDNPMVVPVNTKVKLLVTADDVVHAWWVPELGVKQDAIPGFVNENWFYADKIGTYRGQCGELCGINHGFMPIVVQVVSQVDFDKWVKLHRPNAGNEANQTLTMKPLSEKELMILGKAQYDKSCGMCHQATGLGLPPSFPPLKRSRVVTGPLDGSIAFVLTGVPGTAMQAFGQQLNNKEMAGVITYIRHAWGNDKIIINHKQPIIVQPSDIERVRRKNL
ncbi:MAG: ctaC 1 [Gammaproteobacteria bacterium]|nr:ctaC 1 [Gammaproteobacteria bacterium]